MPPTAEIAVEAVAVARNRRRDMGMRTVMETLRLYEGGEDGGRLSQNADDYVTPLIRITKCRGEAPIVFTPGSAMWRGHDFFDTAVEACLRMRRRAILLSRHREHIPANLPPTIRHFDFIPFSQVLPHASALVHHGGIGSCSQALAAGVRDLHTGERSCMMDRLGKPAQARQAVIVGDRELGDVCA